MSKYDEIIEIADRIRTTINTAGWKDILNFMKNKKEYYTQIALTEKDLYKIYYAQAFVEAIDTINLEINGLIREGNEAEKLRKK
ncbi:MAG TPA: hypothetical protein ENN27_00550 [Candidatus Atribacteria bacterium]|mgnify:CR=1 FL=1|nr:hypothetical protein [Candidatus Atribacteria bacterium]